MGKGWTALRNIEKEVGDLGWVQTLPINDSDEHIFEVWCECEPEDIGDGILSHNSFDRREHDEPKHVIRECDYCIEREINKYMQGGAA